MAVAAVSRRPRRCRQGPGAAAAVQAALAVVVARRNKRVLGQLEARKNKRVLGQLEAVVPGLVVVAKAAWTTTHDWRRRWANLV